ncbi:MAG: hypothetical protein KF800_17095 [Lysobacter sp.]|nr:hypothetical protein [Lysobacter sp.]
MKPHREALIDMLEAHGWYVYSIEREDAEWWIDETWELHSTWSPTTTRAWLAFLVDPQHEGNRQAGEGVWGIDLHAHAPPRAGHALTGICMSDLRRPDITRDFLARLDALRTKA